MKQRIPLIVTALVILGVIFLTYSNHFHNSFHFDDAHTIEDNAYIRDIHNIPLFFKDVSTTSAMPSHQGYRPLVTTTLAIDYAMSLKSSGGKEGYNTFWYHVSSFSWFLLVVILIYFIQVKLYDSAFNQPYNKYFAMLGCAWYGLHTVNAETVNYIIQRSEILSTSGIVASFVLYLAFENLRKYYLYLIPAILGMFAKETTVMFAPALIMYDYIIVKQKSLKDIFKADGLKVFGRSFLIGTPALIICAALGIFSIKIMTKVIEIKGTESPVYYIISQPYIVLHYITQFFFPFGLTADTDIPEITSLADDRLFIGFAFVIGLILLAFKTSDKKEWRPFSFGIIWFLLMLLPTSLVALAEVTNDHRPLLPFIGLIFSMVCLVANLYYNILKSDTLKKAVLAVAMFAVLGYAYGAHERNKVWKTDQALWKDVSEKSPRNGRGWMNYGLTLMGIGDYLDAQYAYDQALIYTPRYYILHINLGVLKEAQGKKFEAEQYYKNALDYGPGYVESYYYYARYLYNMGRVQEAEIYCKKSLDIFGGYIYSRYLLMDIYYFKKDWQNLLAASQTTLSMYPGDGKAETYLKMASNPATTITAVDSKSQTAGDLLNQSLAYYYAGKYRECIDACNKALELQPNYPEAYNNIGTAYNQLQKYDSAVWACGKAVELKPDFQLAKNNLEWAKSQLKKK